MLMAAWARAGATTLRDRSRNQANIAPATAVDAEVASTASRRPLFGSATRSRAGLPW
jgi:hypothetical protein